MVSGSVTGSLLMSGLSTGMDVGCNDEASRLPADFTSTDLLNAYQALKSVVFSDLGTTSVNKRVVLPCAYDTADTGR